MAQKIKVNLDFRKQWQKFVKTHQFKDLLEDYVVEGGIKEMIKRGDSPIKTYGRFKGYAVDRIRDKNPKYLYPNSVKRKYADKLRRPVNLSLSGEYLDKLRVKKRGDNYEVGFFSLTSKQRKMFDAHNMGKNKHIPMRKHLPTQNDEEFKEVIMQSFTKGLERLFKRFKITD